jgi:hypothetical protein
MLLIVTDDRRLLLHHRDDKPSISHPSGARAHSKAITSDRAGSRSGAGQALASVELV